MRSFKPNTTINIPVEVLERAREFLSENSEITSRNILIEKSLTYFMDHWEDIKKAADAVFYALLKLDKELD